MTGLRTRLCDVLGINIPILQAGMAAYTNAEPSVPNWYWVTVSQAAQ